jgi:adenylate cyclase
MIGSGSSHVEIERKFLVRALPPAVSRTTPIAIDQGYLAVDHHGTEVRIRKKGKRFTLTVKQGVGLARRETEIDLTQEQFDALWPQTEGRRVRKERFEFRHGRWVIEADAFRGPLEGLLIAEVEFDSVENSAAFDPPGWFDREVTGDARYNNCSLALDGWPG